MSTHPAVSLQRQPTAPRQSMPKRTNSRNGCQECKKARLKCDEKKPSCAQCKRRNKQCPGYSRLFKWSTKHEILQPQLDTTHNRSRHRFESRVSSPSAKTEGAPFTSAKKRDDSQKRPIDHGASQSKPRVDPLEIHADGRNKQVVVASDKLPATFTNNSPNSALGCYIQEKAGCRLRRSLSTLSPSARDNSPQQLSCGTQVSVAQKFNPAFAPLPSVLLDYWFQEASHLCMGYVSGNDKSRQIASLYHCTSGSVSSAMQSMSAACLRNELPQVKKILPSLVKETLAAIREEIAEYLTTRVLVHTSLPSRTLFATFTLGHAMLWIGNSDLALNLRDSAAKMLGLYGEDHCDLEQQDREYLSFLRCCLVQWECRFHAEQTDRLNPDNNAISYIAQPVFPSGISSLLGRTARRDCAGFTIQRENLACHNFI